MSFLRHYRRFSIETTCSRVMKCTTNLSCCSSLLPMCTDHAVYVHMYYDWSQAGNVCWLLINDWHCIITNFCLLYSPHAVLLRSKHIQVLYLTESQVLSLADARIKFQIVTSKLSTVVSESSGSQRHDSYAEFLYFSHRLFTQLLF